MAKDGVSVGGKKKMRGKRERKIEEWMRWRAFKKKV